jgi:predicted Fe-Mo cluster-binding NifX family protein
MAKAAFASWNGRIAPVFDVTRSLHLVETEGGRIVNRKKVRVAGDMANLKAACLAELGVGTLVCGAISKPLQRMISAYGIQVIAFVAGNLQEVIQAWVCGRLAVSDAYAMPGCRKARGQRTRNPDRGKSKMDDTRGAKKGAGRRTSAGGQGQGSRPAGPGPDKKTTQDVCVCPVCGYATPHQRGVPCKSKKCPTCEIILARQ